MNLYRKSIICDLSQTFDEAGTILEQFVDEIRSEYFVIDTEFNIALHEYTDDLPVPLEVTTPVLLKTVGVQQQLRVYMIRLPIEVWQLFDEAGRFLGQKLNGFVEVCDDDEDDDLCHDGIDDVSGPFCCVGNWNGRKMKMTPIEQDKTLPYPHFPLPFSYDLKIDFVQPDKLSIKKRRLVEKFL
jgi:hypothetical protein